MKVGSRRFQDAPTARSNIGQMRRFGLVALFSIAALAACSVLRSTPVVLVSNQSAEPVVVRIETDIDEQYGPLKLGPGKTAAVDVSPRDKALWLVVERRGHAINSEQVYVSSSARVTSIITEQAVSIRYEL